MAMATLSTHSLDDSYNPEISDYATILPVGQYGGPTSNINELALIASPRKTPVERKGSGGQMDNMTSVQLGLSCDVIYENQRGLFIHGVPYFSASTLFPFDPAGWTIFGSHSDHTAVYSATSQAVEQSPSAPQLRQHCRPGSRRGSRNLSLPLVPSTHASLPRQRQSTSTPPSLHGTPFTPASFQLPSSAWHWTSPWSIIIGNEGTTDEHGWEYNWIFRKNGWKARLNELGWAGYVRRRKWTRARECQEAAEADHRNVVYVIMR